MNMKLRKIQIELQQLYNTNSLINKKINNKDRRQAGTFHTCHGFYLHNLEFF